MKKLLPIYQDLIGRKSLWLRIIITQTVNEPLQTPILNGLFLGSYKVILSPCTTL